MRSAEGVRNAPGKIGAALYFNVRAGTTSLAAPPQCSGVGFGDVPRAVGPAASVRRQARMLIRSVRVALFASSAALALLFVPAASAQASDPFAAGQRWRSAASAQDAWLPQSLAFAARGELLWSAHGGANPRLELFDSAPFSSQLTPRAAHARPGVAGVFAVAAGRDAHALFALAQYPGPTPATRWTELSRYDAFAADPSQPVWARTFATPTNGAARVHASAASDELLATLYDQGSQSLRLEWVRGADGAELSTHTLNTPSLRQVGVARDLSRVALSVGAQVRVVARSGALELNHVLAAPTNALALSGDGARLAFGDGSALRVFVRAASGWSALREFSAGGSFVPTRVALSNDGATLAIGWWDAQQTQRVRFELWSVADAAPRYARELSASGGMLQNFPESVVLAPDGRRAAFGAWGTNDAQPEALLVDAASGQELFALDLGGSVRTLALDDSGTRLAVGFKHTHANLVGATGEVRCFDTGEREVQLLNVAQLGAPVQLTARRALAQRVYLLRGPLAAQPTPFASAAGGLWIERLAVAVQSRRADTSGRADFTLAIPLGGWPENFALQAYFRGGGQAAFSRHVLVPVVR